MIFGRRRRRTRARQRQGADADRGIDQMAYELVWFRTLDKDVQMWQAPALALTAQSFLLTIALGSGSEPTARVLSAGLATLIAGLSIQLMTKQQWLLRQDFAQLERLEESLGLEGLNFRHRRAEHTSDKQLARTFWRTRRSVQLWQAGMTLFGLTSLLILGLAIFQPELLASA